MTRISASIICHLRTLRMQRSDATLHWFRSFGLPRSRSQAEVIEYKQAGLRLVERFRSLCTLSHTLASRRRCRHDGRRDFATRASSRRLLPGTNNELHSWGVGGGIGRRTVRCPPKCTNRCSKMPDKGRSIRTDDLLFASYRTSYASRLRGSIRTRGLAFRGHRCENTVWCTAELDARQGSGGGRRRLESSGRWSGRI